MMMVTGKNSILLLGTKLLMVGFAFAFFEQFIEHETFSYLRFIFDGIEKTIFISGIFGGFYFLNQMRQQQEEQKVLFEELEAAHLTGTDWRNKAKILIDGIGAEIDKQLSEWDLTPAERDIALLMIKGFAHKEIAQLRGTSEGTIRQQARVIFLKSGLQGKVALSAYFLEDLLPAQVTDYNKL